ncbi:MAG: M81 family metallopeptidase, partial [Pseudomonadota bacterium]
ETNTFAPETTALARFVRRGAWPELVRGDAVAPRLAGLNLPLAGFLDACVHETVPILWAGAEPGGYVEDEAFEAITGEIVAGCSAAAPDAIYLDLHGAMVTRAYDDAEAEILARLRRALGDLPIAVSLDLHANVSRDLFERASVITLYRTYPHLDMAETGARAARLLERTMAAPLAKAFRQGETILPITAQSTEFEPAQGIYRALRHSPAVSVDLAMGFPPADIPEVGPAIVAYAESAASAEAAADAVLSQLRAAEPAFDDRLMSPEAAVARALATAGTVVIADPEDNPGAGATGDTTGILAALIAAKVPDAILGMLHDPAAAAAAHAAGIGAEIEVALGGGHPEFSAPIACRTTVEALSDGRFQFTGPMFGGGPADLGPVARLRVAGTGIEVVVASERAQNADQEMFRCVGLEPREHAIVCVKSAVHFMADYAPIAAEVLFAKSPGANPCDLSRIPYSRLTPGRRLGPGGPVWTGP